MKLREGSSDRWIDCYENVQIGACGGAEIVVGEAGEVAGGPFEGDGAGEHRPERQQDDGPQRPELVAPFAEK